MISLIETPPMLRAIGLVTVRWASVDLTLADVLGEILGNQEAGMTCVFDAQNFGVKRFESFISIVGASELSKEDREKLISRAKVLKELLAERNRIVHSPLILSAHPDHAKFGTMVLGRLGRSKGRQKSSRFSPTTEEEVIAHADRVELEARFLRDWLSSKGQQD